MKKIILAAFTLIQINIWALEVAAPKAPPSLPLLRMEEVDLTLYQDVSTEVVPSILRGRGEIYILPVNVGAALYRRGASLKLLGVTSEGLLSLLSSDIVDIQELEGKELYLGGQGSSPDVITSKILSDREIDTLITYRSSPEIAKLMMAGRVKNAVLPEPLASMVLSKNPRVKRVAELKDLWDDTSLPQVGIFAMDETISSKPAEVESFLIAYREALGNIAPKDMELAISEFSLRMDVSVFSEAVDHMNLTLSRDRKAVESYLRALDIEVEGGFYGW